jgi:hypothetical protein
MLSTSILIFNLNQITAMKLFLSQVFAFLIVFSGSAQQKDTVFLKKENVLGSYNIVYVDNNKRSMEYFKFSHTQLTGKQKTEYDTSFKYMLDEVNYPTSYFYMRNLAKNWIPLHSYKGEFYLYSASNWDKYSTLVLTDSTIVYSSFDGCLVDLITQFEQKNYSTYSFKTVNNLHDVVNVELFIIDPARGIAIWKSTHSQGVEYQLMVNALHFREFPIAIAKCSMGECLHEFEFDKINYEKLIKKSKHVSINSTTEVYSAN